MSIEEFNRMPHYLTDYIEKYALERPDDIAIIDADDGKFISWKHFDNMVNMIALQIHEMGFIKGDIIITMLPFLMEHIYLMYASFKLGLIICPLDVRLKKDETIRCVQLLKDARRILYIHLDDTDSEDKWGRSKFYEFKQFAQALRKEAPFVKDYIQLSPEEDADEGTLGWFKFMKRARTNWLKYSSDPTLLKQKLDMLNAEKKKVDPFKDGCMIIYTTGSTGFPKPAVLSNAGIICQNYCMSKGFSFEIEDRMLVNLPPSHVGGTTEQLMTTIFKGGTSVVLHAFKADKTLKAIEDYKVTVFGQIPSLFVMEWRLPNYAKYDLKSLKFALYGGQAVSKKFLEKLSGMAKFFGSGLGLTEMSGFTSYTPFGGTVDDILSGLGVDFPVTPLSIRKPMKDDGYAGEELPSGETGEVCYTGPQVFLGYYGNEEATRKTISKDGVCYTGDMGFKDAKGLHLVGRGRFVIKPKGYQVYPPEVEEFIQRRPEVSLCGVIGVKHEVFTEGVVAFIEFRKGKSLTVEQLKEHCKELAAYKRPELYVFLDEIPLNRVDKTDYQELKKMIEPIIEKERAAGRWDSERPKKVE